MRSDVLKWTTTVMVCMHVNSMSMNGMSNTIDGTPCMNPLAPRSKAMLWLLS